MLPSVITYLTENVVTVVNTFSWYTVKCKFKNTYTDKQYYVWQMLDEMNALSACQK